jgi:DNA repair exonuclease SbcCD ATPase subunit
MAWLGWIVSGFLACGLGIFALMRQQQLDSLHREFKHATQAWTVQQKNDLRDLEDSLARLEVDVGREKAKTIEARIEHDRVRDEVDSLDNKVAEARRDLDAVSAEIASQDPEQVQAILERDAKRLDSDIRRLRNVLPAMKTGSTVGGGVL